MSADRFEIHDHGSKLTVRDTKYGSEVSMLRVRSYSRELTVMAGAIRQQARDLDQLRADLAAAVADRERMAKHIKELDAECSVIAKDCTYAEQQNDTLRARIAAIDAAPTVGWLRPYGRGLSTSEPSGERMPQYELIARPAKD